MKIIIFFIVATYPLDLTKTRLQVQGELAAKIVNTADGPVKYCYQNILQLVFC